MIHILHYLHSQPRFFVFNCCNLDTWSLPSW